ncbi:MAG: MtrB/PioB family decaheme-associated outer membrane protein [Woeseiaceae bacterium]|nr:MtrB/PioB family decaheme-associated outer membrane protein [Woeseiaceae bacterium]
MRRNTNFRYVITTVLLAPAAAMAQVDTSDWNCEYCPFDEGYRAEYEAGAAQITDDAFRFGNGTGLGEEGTEAILNGEGRYLGESSEVTWYAEELGTDARFFEMGAGKPGRFGVELGYRELPYRRFGDTETPYSGSGEVLNLPAGWVPGATTGTMPGLADALAVHEIETDRTVLDLGMNYLATRNVRLLVDYERQERDGTGIMPGSFFSQGAYLPRPIDDYTDRFDAAVAYSNESFDLKLAYYGSFYRNELESLTWDNAFTPFPGADQGRLALEPDNDFQQFSISGAYRAASAWNTVVGFSAAIGQGEQTASLLPYTINPLIVTAPINVSDIDGEVDTTNYALKITARPLPKLNVRASYRYDERDNSTPAETWTRVITDALTSGDIEPNVPYSFDRARLNLTGNYRLLDTLTVSAAYVRTEIDRDFQEVASQDEDTGWGKLRWRPTPYLEATFKGGTSTRSINKYDTDVGLLFNQNPLMRKYNLAHRYREFAEVGLSASLIDTPISIGMTYLWTDDDYSKSDLGLLEGTEDRFTVDFNWAVSERSSLYLNAGSEAIESLQVGSESFAGPEWEATHDDDFFHYGGGFTIRGAGEKVDLTFDYTRAEGETEILFDGQSVAAEPLPELESTMDSLRFRLDYNVSQKLTINASARWERFEAEDWGLQDVAVDTISNVLTMGADPYDYDVWVFGIGFRYSVGADPE